MSEKKYWVKSVKSTSGLIGHCIDKVVVQSTKPILRKARGRSQDGAVSKAIQFPFKLTSAHKRPCNMIHGAELRNVTDMAD